MTRVILGLNAYHGDAAAALIVDGEVVAAVAEERLTRIKHAAGFPAQAVKSVVAAAGIEPEQIEVVAIGRDPRANRLRKLAYLARYRPSVRRAILPRLKARRHLRSALQETAAALDVSAARLEQTTRLVEVEHHLAHAAAAFLGSPFSRAAILTADGFGDFVSTGWGVGAGHTVNLTGRVFYPHSLGILYQAVTQFIGFPYYGDEGKTMGLSPYGRPVFVEQLQELVKRTGDAFMLNPDYFTHVRQGVETSWTDATPDIGALYNKRWTPLFGPPRHPEQPQTQREADLAMSVQVVLESCLFHLLAQRHRATQLSDLCFAGGVALNCVFNGKIAEQSPFQRSYVFPAAGDDGLAVGAAWHCWSTTNDRRPRPVAVPLWGPDYSGDPTAELDLAAVATRPEIQHAALTTNQVFDRTADALAAGKIVGWFRGGCEFGPRALGARSILADPRGATTKDRLNARIKQREPFRPFAPSVLAELAGQWFATPVDSPAMLHAIQVRRDKQAEIPAVTHVDGSGRVQTVARDTHPDYHRLIAAFYERTGVPILLNTSFNENEPIVCTPQQALDCFLRTDMDVLVLEHLWFERHPVEQA